jgi:hypothetical protein
MRFFAAPTNGTAFSPVSTAPPTTPFFLIVAATVASAIAPPIHGTDRASLRDIRAPAHLANRSVIGILQIVQTAFR